MSKIRGIEICFPEPVELPDGWEKTLDSLIGMVCDKYERENPERVMWPAGHGCKPLWDEPNEPKFDETIYQVEVAEREDLWGNNPHNPNADALKEKARDIRKAKKAAKAANA